MMELMFKNLLYALICSFLLIFSVYAQDDQSGFISLDCGLPTNSSYSEPTTTINYISDVPFIDTGVSKTIQAQYKASHQQQTAHLRSFPVGIRNCYRVNITRGTKYLIRASFLYGNYDGLDRLPGFDLHIGTNFWDSVTITNSSVSIIKELIHIPSLNYTQVCLINTDSGTTPFISALEFRPLDNITYVTESGSLALAYRLDVASNNRAYRYDYDVFDRYWLPYNDDSWTQINTSLTVLSHNYYEIPSIVMSTASTPINPNASMDFYWEPPDKTSRYYVFVHCAELLQLKKNQYRAFDITLNGQHLYGPFAPVYLTGTTVYTPSAVVQAASYNFSILKSENSTLPPIINAIEIYTVKDLSQLGTDEYDVVAITNIKSTYGVEKNWQGDPCGPQEYIWEGLNCTAGGSDSPRIISLDLSSSGLTGEITSYISSLVKLESLDLSNNNFSGSVPQFLSDLPDLKVLNLENNKLNGSIPAELAERSRSGSLLLSIGGNEILCTESSCKKEKKSKPILIPLIASIGGGLVLLIAAVGIFIGVRRGKRTNVVAAAAVSNNQIDSLESKKKQFTYSEVLKITDNFKTILGRGGFGTVYHGNADGIQVAVKMLSPSSAQGYQEFQTEVKILMRVHHRNLTSLVGYCNEGTHMALIYEYMANGNLETHLLGSDSSTNVFTWEKRLQVAMDASQGLEYLHNGCKPSIVHRDVKTTNILLTENFQAKLADFGLSRAFPADLGSFISTAIVGTPGYLDPEYHISGRLNEKSDVYSLGVALLQIITGRPVISRSVQDNTHVSQWVSSRLGTGDIKSIVDPNLQGNFEVNSAWKVVELAMDCMSKTSARRPNMSEVVTILKECLAAECARKNDQSHVTFFTLNLNTEPSPSVR